MTETGMLLGSTTGGSPSIAQSDYWWYRARTRILETVMKPYVGTPRRLLDVGSADGPSVTWLEGTAEHHVSLDVDPRGLADGGVCGSATRLPFADGSFDVVFSSFGALQFVSEIDRAVAETARVLRVGGRFAFSITHPTRWVFPDDPGEEGLVASQSYWDRTPYVEVDDEGTATYVEYHHTLGDYVRALAAAGFTLTDLVEPEWPEGHTRVWGQWSPLRGRLFPGTAIFRTHRS